MTANADEELPTLGDSQVDKAVSIMRGTVGVVPLIGPMFAEMIANFIPKQRIERLEDYVLKLTSKLDTLDKSTAQARFQDAETVDLFEEGALQSTRALSDSRREYIATLVAHGISGEEKERIETKRLLSILEQLDDDQIIILTSYLGRHMHDDDDEFHKLHANVLDPVGAHMGSDREDLDRETIYKLARSHLQNLGLIRRKYRQPRRNETPEFDEDTGTLKGSFTELTPLGRLLLRRIGVAGPDEF